MFQLLAPRFMQRSACFGFLIMLLLAACAPSDSPKNDTGTATKPTKSEKTDNPSWSFSADSAYVFVAQQVAFGPRVPGTDAHVATGNWLVARLKGWADDVIEQTGTVTAWDGTKLPMRNIVARFNPDAPKRIMLSAHWDTRPIADQDTVRTDEPIAGANDGGSGVGVLLEIARQLAAIPVDYGVDIVLFDVEDYGNSAVEDSYCLGSQHWSKEPHIPGYQAEFGILLDMVGAKGAYFYREGISMYFAPGIVSKVWDAAARSGKRDWFVFNEAPYPPLTDDHFYVNRIAGIPTIDIIQYDPDNPRGFGDFWHTHRDDMDIIDPRTLGAVGETLLTVLAAE